MSDSRFVTLRPHALARAALVCASALAAAAWAQSPAQQDSAKAQKSAPAAAQDLPQVRITDTAAPVDAQGFAPRRRASVTRSTVDAKDTPFTIETVQMQDKRERGYQDLGQMLEGVAGVDAGYGAWYDSIFIRGFEADLGDIYRDGVRSGGNFRRSTSNVERIEVLKGPASVLYGRSQGGGVINLVSKKANFESPSAAHLRAGT